MLALACCLGASGAYARVQSRVAEPPPTPAITAPFDRLPMRFEVNRGQAQSEVKFICRTAGYTLYLDSSEFTMSLPEALLQIRFLGAETQPRTEGLDLLPGKTNYFLGNDPTQWRPNVPSYSEVKYSGVYPGIDLVFHGNGRHIEFDFVISPGSDPRAIRLGFHGANGLMINPRGDLVLSTASGPVIHRKPRLWQQRGAKK